MMLYNYPYATVGVKGLNKIIRLTMLLSGKQTVLRSALNTD